MQSVFHYSKRAHFFATLLGAVALLVILAGCGNGGGGTSNTPQNGKGCTKIGVLLPETNSSPRWEAYDHPLLVDAIKKDLPNATVDYNNANGNSDTQQSQAEADLTKGDCILVVAAHDSSAAAAIVTAAKRQNVPVIAYDRLIQSNDLNFYVSFDNVKVGELQGQYIVDHYKDPQYGVSAGHNNIAFIKGADTDNNAHLFAQGAHEKIDPLVNSGDLVNVYEQFTPNWNPPDGQTEMEAALTKTNNNIQVVYAANDDLGGAVVQALTPLQLQGKVLITGQDATVAGLQRILEGTQSMTVYKPIAKEAQATADLIKALNAGTSTSSLTNGATTATSGGANIPSVLETPISVDKSNIASTVIADGYVTKDQVCTGLPAGTDSQGICS